MGDFFLDIFRSLTFILDKAIYTLVEVVYQVFYYLASAQILDETIVTNFTIRLYTILGILMVFVLAWNLLNYIVDPDKIQDKKIGATAFLKDVIIALVIMSLSPMLFTKLYAFQNQVLTSGVISNLVLGGATSESMPAVDESTLENYDSITDYYIEHGANSMVASVYVAFLYPNDNFTALDCGTAKDDGTYADYCGAYKMVKEGHGLSSFDEFVTNDDYNFTPFLTTIAGIVLLFFMLSFCLNLGKRVGKMAILQLIAPVPCTLELVPNKKGVRSTWITTLIKVYLEVFFFMLVMYIIIFLISLIPNVIATLFADVGGEIGFVKLITIVMLIFGLLAFGKEAPQMVFDLLGIKSTGVIKDAALRGIKMAGSATSAVGAGTTSLVRNAAGTIRNVRDGGGVGAAIRGVGGMATGAVGGAFRGAWMNRSGGFKNIAATTSRAINAQANAQRRTSAAFGQYARDIQNASGLGKVGAALSPARRGIASGATGVKNWATGDNRYSAETQRIEELTKAKSYFKNVTTGYAAYEEAGKVLDKAKIDSGFNTAFASWNRANGGNNSTNDFIAALRISGGSYNGQDFTDIIRLTDEQNAIKDARVESKGRDVSDSALDMLQFIEHNRHMNLSADAVTKRDALRALIDDNGNLLGGASYKDVYDALEKLNKQLEKDIGVAQSAIRSRQRDEEFRRGSGNNNSGSGNNS